MQLIYLSPVPWSSFAQRPHKFVEWFHTVTGGDVLWVDPYPTRLPTLADVRRLWVQHSQPSCISPPWLRLSQPFALPIEPLPLSGRLNSWVWKKVLREISDFSHKQSTLFVVGKPSLLALVALKQINPVVSVYDVMDDFPSFYSGLSRAAMRRREMELIGLVTHAWASSTALSQHLRAARADVQLVPNALDAALLPATKLVKQVQEQIIFGYVGTIGSWFDWEWVMRLATTRPRDLVRLIGPMFTPLPYSLPANVEVLPACTHQDALLAMQKFDVGLIPFKKNDLTASVDPIKYYEYRALGLPIISTNFGEMAFRKNEAGTFLSAGCNDIAGQVQSALLYEKDIELVRLFTASNTWAKRFAATKIIQLHQ